MLHEKENNPHSIIIMVLTISVFVQRKDVDSNIDRFRDCDLHFIIHLCVHNHTQRHAIPGTACLTRNQVFS